MSQYRAHTDAVLSALSVFAQVAKQRNADQCQVALAQIRSGTLAHMADALVSRRVDAVKDSFTLLLSQYAEQARHLMAQQRQYADAELDTADPFRRVELRARIHKIDTELALIRIDAQHLCARMTDIIVVLGGSVARFVEDMAQPLGLSAPA